MLKLPDFVRWTSRRTPAPVRRDSLEAFRSEQQATGKTGKGSSRTVVPGLLVVLLAVVLGWLAVQRVGGGVPPEVSTASLTIESDPAGAEVHVAGVRQGTTPVTLRVAPGPHTVELVLGSRRQTLTTTASADAVVVHRVTFVEAAPPPPVAVRTSGSRPDPPTATPRPAGPVAGWLSVTSSVPLQVLEGNQVVGTTAAPRIMLASGRHELRFVNEQLGFSERRSVRVDPGKSAVIRIDIPRAPLSLNAIPWAEAWIDGAKVGTTPIGNHMVPIGTHEVVFRHPEFGERRETVTVSVGKPTRVSVDMRRPRS